MQKRGATKEEARKRESRSIPFFQRIEQNQEPSSHTENIQNKINKIKAYSYPCRKTFLRSVFVVVSVAGFWSLSALCSVLKKDRERE